MKAFLATLTLKIKIIISCISAFVIAGTAVGIGFAVTREEAYRVLKVFEMTGKSIVTRIGAGELETYVGMNLESGDRLTVGKDSTLRISLDSDKYILLDGGTILELTATGTAADSRTIVKLIAGTILNEITNPLSENSSYQVATPKATMAVRGTSFMVSVEEDEEGGYTINTNTFDGKVEVVLIDSDGNATDKSAMVTTDNGITIRTEPNKETNNPAEVDGFSNFVFINGNGETEEVSEGEDPVKEIRYEEISEEIRRTALRSNSSSLMVLDNGVVSKLIGGTAPEMDIPEESVTETIAPETRATTLFMPETVLPETNVPEITDIVTTTPFVTVPEAIIPETTAPETTVPETTVPETTVPETTAPETTTTEEPPIIFPPAVVTYEVAFECEGNIIKTVTVESGETVPASEIPTVPGKQGYTGKWVLDGKDFNFTTVITADATVKAEYIINNYTVTFVDENGVTITAIECGYGKTIPAASIPEVPEKPGYTGVWRTGIVDFTENTVITGNITVKPAYTMDVYTVTFEDENGSAIATVSCNYGETVPAAEIPDIPEKAGHVGTWTMGAEDFTSATVITGSMTVTAAYTPKPITVTFEGVSGEYYFNSGETFASSGYTFPTPAAGFVWLVDGGSGNRSEFSADTVITADINVLAVDTNAQYTVNCTYSNGYSEAVTAPYGTKVNTLALPEIREPGPANQTSSDVWYFNGNALDDTVIIKGDIELTTVKPKCGHYTFNYAILFDGNFTLAETYEYYIPAGEKVGDYFTAAPTYTYADESTGTVTECEFSHYTTAMTPDTAGDTDITFSVTADAENYSYYCSYRPVTYDITYTDETGALGTVTVNSGIAFRDAAMPALPANYQWYSDDALKTIADDSMTITGDIEVTAAMPVTSAIFPDAAFRSYLSPDGAAILPYNIIEITIDGSTDAAYASIASLQGIGNLTSLTSLSFNDTAITQIPVSELTNLTSIRFNSNPINSALDLSSLNKLTFIRCPNNGLTGLKVPASIEMIHCFSNELTEIDVSMCTKLRELSCTSNLIQTLDVSGKTNLTLLHCNTMPTLTYLNIAGCSSLTVSGMNLGANGLSGTTISITGCTLLIADIDNLNAMYPDINFIQIA